MFRILLEADYALFTRPESKVERVTYPFPTPSAPEGIIKAIYWKPAIRIVIDKIIVFRPVQYLNIRKNEVKEKVKYSAVKKQMHGEGDPTIYTKECTHQRSSMILKKVKYGVEFHFELTGICSEREEENAEQKHASILRRRPEKGQCFRQPCMGCSEYPVRSIRLVDNFDLSEIPSSLKGTQDPGYMLYGLNFADDARKKDEWKNEYFSDKADAVFYHPLLVDGVIDVAKYREEQL